MKKSSLLKKATIGLLAVLMLVLSACGQERPPVPVKPADQVEQNDNNLDGIINNVVNVIDDNANGIPDEDEKIYERQSAPEKVKAPKVSVHEKEEKTSLLKMLHDCKPEVDDKPYRQMAPELVL